MQPSHRVAVLIDADNVAAHQAAHVMQIARSYGSVYAARAYGNFISQQTWPQIANANGLQAIHHKPAVSGKNGVDIAMAIDALDLLHAARYDVFVVVTSDADFTPLAHRLKSSGVVYVGIGKPDAHETYRLACSEYHALESAKVKAAQQSALTAPARIVGSVELAPATSAAVMPSTASLPPAPPAPRGSRTAALELLVARCLQHIKVNGGTLDLKTLGDQLAADRLWPNTELYGGRKLRLILARYEFFGFLNAGESGITVELTPAGVMAARKGLPLPTGEHEPERGTTLPVKLEPVEPALVRATEEDFARLVQECVAVCTAQGGTVTLRKMEIALANQSIWPNPQLFGSTKLAGVIEESGLFHCDGCGPLAQITLKGAVEEAPAELGFEQVAVIPHAADASSPYPDEEFTPLIEEAVAVCRALGASADLVAIGSALTEAGLWPNKNVFRSAKLRTLLECSGRFRFQTVGTVVRVGLAEVVEAVQGCGEPGPVPEFAEADPSAVLRELIDEICVTCLAAGGEITLVKLGGKLADAGLWPNVKIFAKAKLVDIIKGSERLSCTGRGPQAKVVVKSEQLAANQPVRVTEQEQLMTSRKAAGGESKLAGIDPKIALKQTIVSLLAAAPERTLRLTTLGIRLKALYPGFSCTKHGARTLHQLVESLVEDVVFEGSCGSLRAVLSAVPALAA